MLYFTNIQSETSIYFALNDYCRQNNTQKRRFVSSLKLHYNNSHKFIFTLPYEFIVATCHFAQPEYIVIFMLGNYLFETEC